MSLPRLTRSLRPRLIAALALTLAAACSAQGSGEAQAQPPQGNSGPDSGRRETAVFAGGCFWSTESNFEHMPGVVAAVSGYAGGRTASPTYEQVVAGGTGHLEAVRVTYDPARITYRQLVDRFWRTIDPTDARGQFCDRGANYGTAVFATTTQRPIAEASRAAAAAVIGPARFVTPVRAEARFWPAEAYHQDFARRNPARYGGYSAFCRRGDRLRQVWG
ncbi:MAG: peptide-methionine (S)-S-oxide reductase [Brevundimonas sp.]|nr:MAG: peptide-methionine (S)-S-oxide reductase [Brevundimonas sp.]